MIRNQRGTQVDPVPFLVVTGLGFAVSFAFGPAYAMALGASLPVGLALAAAVTALIAAVAYHRYVWTVRPSLSGEVPAADRFRRLIYGMVAGFCCIAALALPFLAT